MALTKDSRINLNDGNAIPIIGLGTYASPDVPKNIGEEATKAAIELGYRHIDCAYIYGNEVQIGSAIRAKIADGTVKREDIFYTGKLWCSFFSPDLVRNGLEKSLKDVGLDYLDLFIMHWPFSIKPTGAEEPSNPDKPFVYDNVDFCSTWEVLEACKDQGLVKSIGVSNFNRRQLERLLNKPGLKHKPVCNQVECHIYLGQSKLHAYCKSKDIVLVAYSVLGSHRDKNWVDLSLPVLLEDPVLVEVAAKYNRSPAEIAMRFVLQKGIVVLAKSFSSARLKQNLGVFDFEIQSEDMKTLEGLDKNLHFGPFKEMKEHPEYPFHDEY
ncbi:PREDICTED: rho crystallin isoform X1 [Nanorana parkeri]|uniref:rho crystallin isoform X1 n=1 Tax=Nanorana parkeri TaxID=125878 RepID=UPI000854243F|nr:PREDICTED: rho crystallin isoform X1 [Nanorana parkeri]